MGSRSNTWAAALLCLALPRTALAQEPPPDSSQAALAPGPAQEPPHELEPGLSVTLGQTLYVVVEGAGVMVLDATDPTSPVVTQVLLPGQSVLAIQVAGNELLVILEDRTVRSFDLDDPLHPAAPDAPVEEQPDELDLSGSVIDVDKGWVVLGLGSAHGVEPGMRFAIKDPTRVAAKPHAIVVISHVEQETCSGQLPPRASAKPGQLAYKVDTPWRARHWLVASAPAPYTHLILEFRPIVGVTGGSGGFISRIELFHHFEKPWGIGFLLSPAGLGVSQAGTGALFELAAVGGYVGRYFGFELGAGAHLSAGLHDNRFIIVARARLGPALGIHVDLGFSIIPDRFWYIPSTASGRLIFPIRLRLDFFFDLSGGNRSIIEHGRSGWANILGGIRAYVHGTGGPGTVILSAGLGHGYVWDEMCEDAEGRTIPCKGGSTSGILISLGVEWRF